MTGPSPVDRGKPGSKLHVLPDRAGIPLAVGISSASTNDGEELRPLVRAIRRVRMTPTLRWSQERIASAPDVDQGRLVRRDCTEALTISICSSFSSRLDLPSRGTVQFA